MLCTPHPHPLFPTHNTLAPPMKEGVMSRDGSHVIGGESNGGSVVIELYRGWFAAARSSRQGRVQLVMSEWELL